MQVFITGTGTNIGKTTFSAWLIHHLNNLYHKNYFYWKPVESGTDEGSDTKFISNFATNIYQPIYSFPQPLSPHLAGKLNNNEIDFDKLIDKKPNEKNLIIEGAGGVFVPINDDKMMVDLIKRLNIPVIIVASAELGTINHTCLTIFALRAMEIEILGVVMNGKKNSENKNAIEKYGNVSVLQEIEDFNYEDNSWREEFERQKPDENLISLFS